MLLLLTQQQRSCLTGQRHMVCAYGTAACGYQTCQEAYCMHTNQLPDFRMSLI